METGSFFFFLERSRRFINHVIVNVQRFFGCSEFHLRLLTRAVEDEGNLWPSLFKIFNVQVVCF